MTAGAEILAHAMAVALLPFLLQGVILRVKSRWAGRLGPPLAQPLYDFLRLLRKRPVYGKVTTAAIWAGPLVLLATSLLACLFVPLASPRPPAGFACDFVLVAYLMGLGRLALMLSALDTGSSFEGMGASREANYGTLTEPTFFLVLGALAIHTGSDRLAPQLTGAAWTGGGLLVVLPAAAALFVVAQVEAARVPVDDPATHLELTMIHEVMVLDHSGPDLAAVQCATGLKLTWFLAAIAALLNPVPTGWPVAWGAAGMALMLALAAALGLVESLVGRLKILAVPAYAFAAMLVGLATVLVAATLRSGGGA